jgi:peptide chain release factor 1
MASEHDRLSKDISETFDAKLSKRIGELKGITTALKEWEETQDSISELNALLKDPSTDQELRELAV